MIFTTSYKNEGFKKIITGIVQVTNPQIAVELGTQQGASAILIGKALKDGKLFTYDSFDEKYDNPPYAETHADLRQTLRSIKAAKLDNTKVEVTPYDAFRVADLYKSVDLLHIDICNHYDNIKKLLRQWYLKVNKVILIEGGGYNQWQKEYKFKPFYPLFTELFILNRYGCSVITLDDNYSLSILTRFIKK